jgi:hypothetical protein
MSKYLAVMDTSSFRENGGVGMLQVTAVVFYDKV